jgi:hypothetical protein
MPNGLQGFGANLMRTSTDLKLDSLSSEALRREFIKIKMWSVRPGHSIDEILLTFCVEDTVGELLDAGI